MIMPDLDLLTPYPLNLDCEIYDNFIHVNIP